MEPQGFRSHAHSLRRRVLWLAPAAFAALVSPAADTVNGRAWAQDFAVSAQVDNTAVTLGEAVTLTITLSGDLAGVELPAFQFPDGVAVAGRSQTTNVSIRSGAVARSLSLVYLLVPQRDGTFQLGPFELTQQKTVVKTEAITVTVKKSALPPSLAPPGERFTL